MSDNGQMFGPFKVRIGHIWISGFIPKQIDVSQKWNDGIKDNQQNGIDDGSGPR